MMQVMLSILVLSEKRSAAPGGFPVAEAKDLTVQATTSLPLHGMAGFKGCRPVPPTPLLVECEERRRVPHHFRRVVF